MHEDNDAVSIGPFENQPLLSSPSSGTKAQEIAKEFVAIYGAGGKCYPEYNPNVGWVRWRKLLYNACLNSTCAITDLDTGRLQLATEVIEGLVRPAMHEIRAAAKASGGHVLPVELVDAIIATDPITMYNPPSMQVDVRKGRYTEFENIVGAPVREAAKNGVATPTLVVLYNLLKGIQWRTKERNGLIKIPEPVDHTGTS